ncbi:MAG: family 16 glycosylhydrolase [Alphaproteobacteria bacterium]
MRWTRPLGLAFAMAVAAVTTAACSNTDVDTEPLSSGHTTQSIDHSEPAKVAEVSKVGEVSGPSIPAAIKSPVAPPVAPLPEPAPPTNIGKMKPGPAFLLDLTKGFDESTQYQSSYTMEVPWNGAGFAPENIHYGRDGATLVIHKTRMRSLHYAGAELQRKGFYGYGRYEGIVRAPTGSGLVSSFFTHTSGQFGDPHDEIDIEFLGRDTHQLHINYFKDGIPAGSYYAPLDFDTSKAFHLYAFEWAPDSIKWYADGRLVHEVHGPAARVPRAAGRVIMNLWSGGPASGNWLGPSQFKNNSSVVYRCVSHVPLGETAPQCSDGYTPPTGD